MNFDIEFLNNRVQWRSSLSFIIVTVGAIIGIGNFWLFPNLIHQYGGGFFILYFACLLLVGLPAMMAEMIIGRRGRQNQVSTLELLSLENGASMRWRWLGWWTAMALLLVLSFYIVFVSFSMIYGYHFLTGHFDHLQGKQFVTFWQHFLANPKPLLKWNAFMVAITVLVVMRGVRHGLEVVSYLAIFLLFFLLLIMIGFSIKTHHIMIALQYIFVIKPALFTVKGALTILSYTFFTLSLGVGSLLVYGSYLPHRTNLTRSIFWIVVLEVVVSILIWIALYPFLMDHFAVANQGLGLLYESLPQGLIHLKHCRLDGALFYFILFLAGWTSAISFFEPLTIVVIERFHLSRITAACLLGIVIWLMGIGVILSFDVWANVKLFHTWNFLNTLTMLTTEIMLPIGGLGFCLFAGWVMSPASTREELSARRFPWIYSVWRFLVRYIAPVLILTILFASVFNII